MARKMWNLPGVGYQWAGSKLVSFQPTSQWIVVKEDLGRHVSMGLVLPDLGASVWGTVLSVGEEAEDVGIVVGDRVLYEEWQGGRWSFFDEKGEIVRVLIMSVDAIGLIVR